MKGSSLTLFFDALKEIAEKGSACLDEAMFAKLNDAATRCSKIEFPPEFVALVERVVLKLTKDATDQINNATSVCVKVFKVLADTFDTDTHVTIKIGTFIRATGSLAEKTRALSELAVSPEAIKACTHPGPERAIVEDVFAAKTKFHFSNEGGKATAKIEHIEEVSAFVQAAGDVEKKAADVIKVVGEAIREHLQTSFLDTFKVLPEAAGGVGDGTNWLASFTGKS